MPCYPGSRSDQEMPEGVRHVVTAITSAQDDAALLASLGLLKSWHFEEAVSTWDPHCMMPSSTLCALPPRLLPPYTDLTTHLHSRCTARPTCTTGRRR